MFHILSCCTGAILGIAVVTAQNVSFTPPKNLPFGSGSSCCSVVSGDFNGDGKLDVVVGDLQLGFTVMLGNGAGNFVSKSIGAVGQNSKVVAASDLNRDGKLDLLIVSYPASGGNTTYALFGNGDGTFELPVSISSDELRTVADFNSDRIPDLLFLTADRSGFYVRLGNGDRTFRPPAATSIFNPAFAASVAVGDLNGDGKPDVVWSHAWHDGGIDIWLGNGDGTFQSPPGPMYAGGDDYGLKPMVIADFNHDGKMDLAICIDNPSAVTVLLGNGDGTFRSRFVFLPVIGAGGIVAADFNGDGNLDVASGFAVLLGKGDGTFQAPAYFPNGHSTTVAAIAADFNGDNLPDLILTPGFGRDPGATVSLSINDSPGKAASVAAVSAASSGSTISPASLASIYGSHLGATTAIADSEPWPTELGGIRVQIHDSGNTTKFAQLVYVSPTQINFLVPDGLASGWSIITIDNGTTPVVEGTRATEIASIAPGFFSVDGSANGVAAASAARVLPNGKLQPVDAFSCSGGGQCTATPIDLTSGPVYLSLFGTGFRQTSANGGSCQLDGRPGNLSARVTFFGPQPTVPGLDQITMLLNTSLPSGPTDVRCYFSSMNLFRSTNTVQIAIK